MTLAYIGILALTAATILLGWGYFRRYRLTRPPLGVVNLGDVTFMVVAIILTPYLYLALPEVLVGALLALSALSASYTVLEPVLPARSLAWAVALSLVAADVALALRLGTTDPAFLAVNNLVLILIVFGVTNLWAQGGLSARDLSFLAAAITLYDAVATGWLPLTADLIERLAGLPFLPLLAWPVGDRWVGLGLGDLLLATVATLVFRKAYGRTAGLAAVALSIATILLVVLLAASGLLHHIFPVMIILGPALVAQRLYWSRRTPERTTADYLATDPPQLAPKLLVPNA